jgi:endonuclease YncB( thermonuclease family)
VEKKTVIIFLLMILTGTLYYLYTDNFSSMGNAIYTQEEMQVKRAIDGDTLEMYNGEKIRMLGINTPEKKEFYSLEATAFTQQLINKSIIVEYKEKDKYGRILGYIFYNGENFNEKLISNGFAHSYFYDQDKYYEDFRGVEEFARNNQIGIWKHSTNYGCLNILEFKYVEDGERCTNGEKIVLNNLCGNLNVTLKDDATHIDHLIIPSGRFEKSFSCIWNDAGDSLFVWDKTGLILFERYS